MGVIIAIYDFFAHTETGSVRNHLAHCVLAAAIQAMMIVIMTPLVRFRPAALIGAFVGSAFYVGRSQAQTEWLWQGAQWYVSWAFWDWPQDQFSGSVYPIVSTTLTYLLLSRVHDALGGRRRR